MKTDFKNFLKTIRDKAKKRIFFIFILVPILLTSCMTLPQYYIENQFELEKYCRLIFNRSGIKSIKGAVKLHYAECLIQATGLEMKRTNYERSFITINPLPTYEAPF